MSFERRDFQGGAVSTTLVGAITALDTSWTIIDATGWPDGTNGPFLAVFNRATGPDAIPSAGPEEKVLCLSRSGATITLGSPSDRGADGTTSQAWAAPVTFEHCSGAIDVDEANLAVSQTIGQIQAKGDVLTGRSANRFQRTPIGTDDSFYLADSSQPGGMRFGGIPTGAINSSTQLATGVLDSPLLFGPEVVDYTKQIAHPYCHFSSSSIIHIASNSWSPITTFVATGTLDEDDFSLLDASGSGMVVPAGIDGRLWEVSAGFHWDADASGNRRRMRFNCSTAGILRTQDPESVTFAAHQATRIVRLAAGETVFPELFQDTGSGIKLAPQDDLHYFSARLLQ